MFKIGDEVMVNDREYPTSVFLNRVGSVVQITQIINHKRAQSNNERNSMNNSFELAKYNVLTLEEERELIRRFQQENDKKALNKLICHNIKFVIHVVNKKLHSKSRNGGFIKDDLIQQCYFAMVKAAENFDLKREGIRYIQYLKYWIVAITQTYFYKNNSLVKNGEGDIFFEGIISNSDGELINRLDHFIDKTFADQYFDAFKAKEDSETDLILKENKSKINTIIDSFKESLSDKEISILSDRIMADVPLTLAEIGDKYNVSRERIRQIEFRLLDRLRKEFIDKSVLQDWS